MLQLMHAAGAAAHHEFAAAAGDGAAGTAAHRPDAAAVVGNGTTATQVAALDPPELSTTGTQQPHKQGVSIISMFNIGVFDGAAATASGSSAGAASYGGKSPSSAPPSHLLHYEHADLELAAAARRAAAGLVFNIGVLDDAAATVSGSSAGAATYGGKSPTLAPPSLLLHYEHADLEPAAAARRAAAGLVLPGLTPPARLAARLQCRDGEAVEAAEWALDVDDAAVQRAAHGFDEYGGSDEYGGLDEYGGFDEWDMVGGD